MCFSTLILRHVYSHGPPTIMKSVNLISEKKRCYDVNARWQRKDSRCALFQHGFLTSSRMLSLSDADIKCIGGLWLVDRSSSGTV